MGYRELKDIDQPHRFYGEPKALNAKWSFPIISLIKVQNMWHCFMLLDQKCVACGEAGLLGKEDQELEVHRSMGIYIYQITCVRFA